MRIPADVLRRAAAAILAGGLMGSVGCTPPTTPSSGSLELVTCPTTVTRTTQAVLGPLGGLLSLDGTTVNIPSGALTAPTLMTLTIPASQYMEIDVKANDLTSFVFNRDVTIRIDYSRCTDPNLSQAELSVWHIDSETKALLENMRGVDDKSSKSISFKTGHLSAYAIAF